MQQEVGEAGLAPFASELANRRERREARARERRLQEARDERRAAALLKASAGPSRAEVQVGYRPTRFLMHVIAFALIVQVHT